ncbi:MAG: hypothetical protein LBB76_12850 [Azoarcus sp.]|jgi:hypothetical protein|nr:hypothetical protein [Azoarcus sp.]
MNARLAEIYERRGFLRARIATQRAALAAQGDALASVCAAGDGACAAARWARRHALLLGVILFILVAHPRRLPRAIDWGRHLYRLWRGWRIFPRLSILRFFTRS